MRNSPHFGPGRHAAALDVIAPQPRAVARAVQGLLIHGAALEHYGLSPRAFSRETLTVEARLSQLLDKNDAPLDVARDPSDRAVGTCRDYALLACAIFRHHGVEARVRCGFASYLGGSPWEDHWVCEVRENDDWTRVDAQLDPVLRRGLGTAVAPVGLTAAAFVDAAQAWRGWRLGDTDPAAYGHGEAAGPWFMLVNVMRDRLAMADHVTSAWDSWRAVADLKPELSAELLRVGDDVSANPSAPVPEPWWERTLQARAGT